MHLFNFLAIFKKEYIGDTLIFIIVKMTEEEFKGRSDQELLKEAKKIKSSNLYDALIIGFLIGIAIYSTIRNGFGLLSFLPLVYTPIAARNKIRNKALKRVLIERNLN